MSTLNTDNNGDFLCRDLGEFKRVIDKLRTAEDKIILRMNCELPTSSFSKSLDKRRICEDIHKQLIDTRKMREHLLQRCLRENSAIVDQYKEDPERIRQLKTAKANLRLISEESTVEEIVRQQSDKSLRDRCRKELLL